MPRVWRRLPSLILGDARGPTVKARRLAIFAGLTLGALVARLGLLLDRLLLRDGTGPSIEAPVFIVGNARSGTTLLTRLLAGDEERFATFRLWELFCPSLSQKRAVAGAMRLFSRLAPRALARLEAWEERQLPELRKLNPVGVNKTQEDELLLIQFFASPTLAVAFPYMDELKELEYFDDLPETERRAVLSLYRQCVAAQLAFHGSDRTFLSKNPSFVGKLRSILEEFPDARIIYPVRDPEASIPSLLKMMQMIWRGMGFDADEIERASRAVADGCVKDYRYAMEVLGELDPARYATVAFEEFVADPAAAVRDLYDHFGWQRSAAYDAWLDREAPEPDPTKKLGRSSLEDFGLDPETLLGQTGGA